MVKGLGAWLGGWYRDHPITLPETAKPARALVRRGRYDEAIRIADAMLARDPLNWEAWHAKADALNKLKRYDEARAAYEQVLALRPQDAATCGTLGGMLIQLKRYDDAIEILCRATELNPNLDWLWANLGLAKGRQGRHTEALQYTERALDLALAAQRRGPTKGGTCASSALWTRRWRPSTAR